MDLYFRADSLEPGVTLAWSGNPGEEVPFAAIHQDFWVIRRTHPEDCPGWTVPEHVELEVFRTMEEAQAYIRAHYQEWAPCP